MRVLKVHKAAIRRPGATIRMLEALAGIPCDEASRRLFWSCRSAEVRERSRTDEADPGLVFERTREVCYKLIEWRMSMNELCIIL